jgi:phenylalanyl-tRNA synthetase alpha chain
MNKVEELRSKAKDEIERAADLDALRAVEIHYLGKSGEFTALLRTVGTLPAEDRPAFGKAVNEAKEQLQSLVEERRRELELVEERRAAERERIDLTMPGRRFRVGIRHPITQAEERIKAALIGLGFEFFEGPELEEAKYNFEALNYPPDHPAMDDQDTFYVDDHRLMRTQCTAIQGRVFERKQPPLRVFTVGRCYRNEAVDRTHGHTFHQVDAFMVDEGINMSHLKGTLRAFAIAMFGANTRVRFRPDYFPFVEPGVDYAISCPFCEGKGCAVCKASGWIELGGAGLIHPNILRSYGIDTERWTGWAFGLGVERIPMMQYQIDDLRLFYENDSRFLEQFRA